MMGTLIWLAFHGVDDAASTLFLGRMLIFGTTIVLGASVVVHALTSRITASLQQLAEAAEAIAAGNLDRRAAIDRSDEIGRLGAAFNAMADEIADARRSLESRVEERTARLAEAEERARAVLRTANDAYLSFDRMGRIVDWNDQAQIVFGWPAQEAIGRTIVDTIIPPHGRNAHRWRLEYYRRSADAAALNRRFEIVAQRRNWDEFPAHVSVWASGAGDDRTFHALIRDLSERKRAEQALKEARTEADQAKTCLQQIVSGSRPPLDLIHKILAATPRAD